MMMTVLVLLVIGAVGAFGAVDVVGAVVVYSLGSSVLKLDDPPLFVDCGVLHPSFPLVCSLFHSLLLRVPLMFILSEIFLICRSFERFVCTSVYRRSLCCRGVLFPFLFLVFSCLLLLASRMCDDTSSSEIVSTPVLRQKLMLRGRSNAHLNLVWCLIS